MDKRRCFHFLIGGSSTVSNRYRRRVWRPCGVFGTAQNCGMDCQETWERLYFSAETRTGEGVPGNGTRPRKAGCCVNRALVGNDGEYAEIHKHVDETTMDSRAGRFMSVERNCCMRNPVRQSRTLGFVRGWAC